MNLKNKVIVITGSTRGFGHAIAEAMLAVGARVIISGRKQTDVDSVVAAFNKGNQVSGQACDVSVPEEVYALARFAVQKFGQIDVWINNAGTTPTAGGALDFPPEIAEQTFRVNCLGTLNGTQAAMHYMKQAGHGTIVSMYGRGSRLEAAKATGLYAATKAWITSFTRTMAAEYEGFGIQFIGFSPGVMATDMIDIHEVVGEVSVETMKNYPRAMGTFSNPPSLPARQLVELLEKNDKPFVEHRTLSGFHLMKKLVTLIWSNITKKEPSLPQEFEQLPAFEAPVEKE